MMERICFRCNDVHPQGQRCPNESTLSPAGSTRRWRYLRARALHRAGHACERCGMPATDVHHKTERVIGGTDRLENLEALCHDCHKRGA